MSVPHSSPESLAYMRKALSLARRAHGRTTPNPMVGAVVVRKGRIVGQGYHVYKRRDHAETVALARAAKNSRGASLYVNLEPCCHQGRTPPCVQEIIKAGIKRVFVGTRDPNPLVAGQGIDRLRRSSVEVIENVCREEAEKLNEAFFHSIRIGRPFAVLKLAMTLDGRIATRSGDSKWITGPQARQRVHRQRYRRDSILVGIETVLSDNPCLDVRWRSRNSLTKVVLDSGLRTPGNARLFESGDPVLIYHSDSGAPQSDSRYPAHAELVAVKRAAGRLDWDQILEDLDRRQLRSVIIEGGRRIAASALEGGHVRKVCFYYGPRIVGGDGLAAIGTLGFDRLEESVALSGLRLSRLGSDFLVEGYPQYSG